MKWVAVAALAFVLPGCQTVAGGSDLIDQVQTAARAGCKFLPTATTISNILVKRQPALAGAQDIAGAICKAVVGSRASGASARVAGVAIEGEFLN